MRHRPEHIGADGRGVGPNLSSRRRFLASAAGVVGAAGAIHVATGGFRGGLLGAADGGLSIVDSAEVATPAERLRFRPPPPPTLREPPEGKIAFPVDPAADSYILDNYGDCRGTRMHIGVDIMSERGAEVYAVEPATIVRVFENTGTVGWGWTLRTDDDIT